MRGAGWVMGRLGADTGLVLVVLAALGLEDLELPQRAQLPPG